ncbi:MAG: polysaccharide deacetylase family protein [Anaerolineales bacterium]|nr:polysaccharide deacetylase family protein [Anaerolineales bacterium]
MKAIWWWPVYFLTLFLALVACSPQLEPAAPAIPEIVAVETPLPSPSPLPSSTPFQPQVPTATIVPTEAPTPTPSLTPTPTPTFTPTWIYNEAGQVVAPILLYHHIDGDLYSGRYYVSVPSFRAQMETLASWGYTSITLSTLLDALIEGAELPARPVVITFDDGDLDVYENAFPIMQELGFVGVFYIVSNRLESNGFVNVEQMQELLAAGWEIGSHGQTHVELTGNHALARSEILDSKLALEEALGIKIESFAYPFGTIDAYLAQKVQDYGYRAAVGLGTGVTHTWSSLLYLQRVEVYGEYTLEQFTARLPWTATPAVEAPGQ